jgi:hypothetical protein
VLHNSQDLIAKTICIRFAKMSHPDTKAERRFFSNTVRQKRNAFFCLSVFPMNRVARLGEFLPDVRSNA